MSAVETEKKADNEAAASSTPFSSDTKSPNALNPENEIVKPLNQNSTKKKVVKKIIRRVVKVIPRVQKKPKDEKKNVDETIKEKSIDHQNKEKVLEQKKEKTITGVEGSNGRNKRVLTEKDKTSHQVDNVKKKQKIEVSNKGKPEKEKTNHQRNDGKKQKLDERNKGKTFTNDRLKGKNQRDYKDKEKLGGLIFMCNGKTKPDCFRYGVMGVSQSRKESVMGIKLGQKLFLYDFDLKLLYGIYRASSAGGMKLEPNAFGGSFPFQVRFEVDKDCYPLKESVFKNALKESYDKDKHRFKTELTVQETKELSELFRPVQPQQSNAHPLVQSAPPATTAHPVPMPIFPAGEGSQDRKELVPRAHMEQFTRDAYTLDVGSRYHMLSDQEREQHLRRAASTHREIISAQKDTVSQDPLFVSEQEYRAYGLARAQHTIPHVTVPPSDSYRKDLHTEQLHKYHHTPMHREPPPSRKEEVSSDPLFLSEEAYRKYGLGRELPGSTPPVPARTSQKESPPSQIVEHSSDPLFLSEEAYRKYGLGRELPASTPPVPLPDPYFYGASSNPYPQLRRTVTTPSELYSPWTKREAHISNYDYLDRASIDHTQRRGIDEVERERERLYSTYASNALSEYNQRQHLGDQADIASGSVSSRYSFAGPTLYR